MKAKGYLAFALMAISLGSTGCSTLSHTEKGAGIGGAIGAGLGTAVGAATGNPKTGAVVGGLLGAGVGGAIGNEEDQKERDQQHQRDMARIQSENRAADARRLGMIDVVQMNQSRVAPQVIINQIRTTGSTFNLSTADINYLNEQQVPTEVIVAMQQSQAQPVTHGQPRRVYVRDPAIIYERPVYVAPPPPAFGVTYVRHW